MAEAQGATRTNISLPRDLKARMDAVKEPVNWSAIACTAFERKLAEINARKEDATMVDVITRLQAAEGEDRDVARQEGRRAGERWARKLARPKQLRRLANILEGGPFTSIAERLELWMNKGTSGIPSYLCAHINDSATNCGDFWSSTLGADAEQIADPPFALGFIESALDFWETVAKYVIAPMEITFHTGEVNFERDTVVFVAEANGRAIRCAISAEALVYFEDNLGRINAMTTEPKTMLRRFNAARERIEDLARKLILIGRAEPSNELLITSNDVTRSR
jgi:hypothetical protein